MFNDRIDAGRRLARDLVHLRDEDVVVLALPRGGVPVGAEVAQSLDAPLDVIVVRKLGVPFQPELAMGAIGEGGTLVLDEHLVEMADVSPDDLDAVVRREQDELARRVARYRSGRDPEEIAGRTVLIVDDGIATGSTAQAACRVVRAMGAARVVLAAPVAPADWAARLAPFADELVCAESHEQFGAVGRWYHDFTQVSDDDVVELLAAARRRRRSTVQSAACTGGRRSERTVAIPSIAGPLAGDLVVPGGAREIVIFAHGSGSSRLSPRNRWVAAKLNGRRLGTLLFDLLTPDEALNRQNVFDVEFLANRLHDAVEFVRSFSATAGLPVGLFGASTGAAAALWEASRAEAGIAAVVSRGGRPDLAQPQLSAVRSPTLLIVGGHDELMLDLNRKAALDLRCEHRISVVSGATHLFEERGALEQVARLAGDWFVGHC